MPPMVNASGLIFGMKLQKKLIAHVIGSWQGILIWWRLVMIVGEVQDVLCMVESLEGGID